MGILSSRQRVAVFRSDEVVEDHMNVLEHKDLLGDDISVGDIVATHYSGMLSIGRVVRMTKKMVQLKGINHTYSNRLVYPKDCLRMDSEAMTMFVLKTER